MRHAIAVIGANYGDEGKGLMVDALSRSDTVVVRFNGGAQAGHTVVTPEGRRHVFHHHGAGTLRGAATYLSEHFILNPLLFGREHFALDYPMVFASPMCRITTPFDMMLNQWAEEDRGHDRHGSCGLGINETVERCARFGGVAPMGAVLRVIRHEWVPLRSSELGIELTPERLALLHNPAVVDQYETAMRMMRALVVWREATQMHAPNASLIFEGAQGMLLDEDAPGFPFVTRSKTGLANVRELCAQMGVTDLHAVFCTRTYLTRHGAGPMPGEDPALSFPDETNVPNPWQHSLRFGRLDVPGLMHRIAHEVVRAGGLVSEVSVAMTCVDQLDNPELRDICPSLMESRGPTRTTVHLTGAVTTSP